jgi:hypothetical protein
MPRPIYATSNECVGRVRGVMQNSGSVPGEVGTVLTLGTRLPGRTPDGPTHANGCGA